MNRVLSQIMNIFTYGLSMIMLLMLLAGWAQSDTKIEPVNTSSEQSIKAVPENNKAQKNAGSRAIKKLPREFIPSEKIKADSSVPFPVDI